ncbi:hypothetical protein GUJ93_ZPchr0012g21280 [Zizania palustris]|uniref:LisH domain-containing protein n=1 Tax=Zizania palustris TaxID=103762 RepID=A0A8J5WN81_ZIZPA|nr:hypothetical protein GUJ93_ZPchr0012g21280 [Zizania palustris]
MLFVPRQVALAAAAMAKEEPKKEKKSKSKSKSKADKGSGARAAAVAAVASFLESGGFPRALAVLQSEANLEADSWRSSPVILEDLISEFLDSSNSAPGAGTAGGIEQEKTTCGVAEDAGKKKKRKGGDKEVSEAEKKASVLSASQEKETKEKKKKKKDGAEVVESENKAAEPSAAEKPIENADIETKGKKKKRVNLTSEASDKINTGTTAAEVDSSKGKSDGVETGIGGNEKKIKKKQNKSKENVQVVENKEVAGKDPVPKSNDENKSGMEIVKGENGTAPGDNTVVGRKRKLEEVEGSNPLAAKEDNTANQKLSNGSSEDDTKPNKRQKKSSEVCYSLFLSLPV